MFDVHNLPAANATLNSISLLLLALGFRAIRRRETDRHRKFMLAAFSVSALFLISYLVYHYEAGSRAFTGVGMVRTAYLAMLASHIVLAALLVPLALVTIVQAARSRFDSHKKVARLTWPVWMYVSLTGVLVYVVLYVLYPSGG